MGFLSGIIEKYGKFKPTENAPPKDHTENMLKTVEELLIEEGFSVFLGGSRRFGYYRDDSDWDLFASIGNFKAYSGGTYLEPDSKWMQLRKRFELMKFRYKGFNDYSDTPGIQFVSSTIPSIQLTIIKEWDEYVNEQFAHQAVEEKLNENPELLKFIQDMKLSGSQVYRTIRDMETP